MEPYDPDFTNQISQSNSAESDTVQESSDRQSDSSLSPDQGQSYPPYSFGAGLLYSEAQMTTQKLSEQQQQQLRTLIQEFESIPPVRNDNAATRKKIMLRMNEEISDIFHKVIRPYCNCRQITTIVSECSELFAAMMRIPCPVHGLRDLGIIVRAAGDGDPSERALDDLLREYYSLQQSPNLKEKSHES